ncbi:MAG: aminoacyl-tRNA hydrolase [Patescibacteria group bacterium]|nr:aminoacyl-tRNA hydrolase [Patescibacteria group bacterium]
MKTVFLAGLGNPGSKYQKTRHNAGFMLLDYFFEKFREEFEFSHWELKKKLNAEISVGKIGDGKIILFKSQTFMNLSGASVVAAKKYYKVKLENIIVAHDEIDLPLGTFRISTGSSSAGHKGVQNIIDALGTKNFTRLRIGVDNRGDKPSFAKASEGKKIPTEKYVLGKFTSSENKKLEIALEESSVELKTNIK